MNRLKALSKALYKHHFIRYLLAGGSTFVLDFALLYFCKIKLHTSLAVATSIGYWVSIIYNFCLNRWWSFSAAEKDRLHKHATAYSALLAFNYLFTLGFVGLFSKHLYFGISKALAVLIQMSWTYVIYKNYVFRKSGTVGMAPRSVMKKRQDTIADTKATTSTI